MTKQKYLETMLITAVKDCLHQDVSYDIGTDEIAQKVDREILGYEIASIETTINLFGREVGLTISDICPEAPIENSSYGVILTFGYCKNAEKANKAIEEYMSSPMAEILEVENEVETNGDSLMMTTQFDFVDNSSKGKPLHQLFSTLIDPEASKPLIELLKYFPD